MLDKSLENHLHLRFALKLLLYDIKLLCPAKVQISSATNQGPSHLLGGAGRLKMGDELSQIVSLIKKNIFQPMGLPEPMSKLPCFHQSLLQGPYVSQSSHHYWNPSCFCFSNVRLWTSHHEIKGPYMIYRPIGWMGSLGNPLWINQPIPILSFCCL